MRQNLSDAICWAAAICVGGGLCLLCWLAGGGVLLLLVAAWKAVAVAGVVAMAWVGVGVVRSYWSGIIEVPIQYYYSAAGINSADREPMTVATDWCRNVDRPWL